eukprot:364830-Chlamydomonas_euryale.AAC.1
MPSVRTSSLHVQTQCGQSSGPPVVPTRPHAKYRLRLARPVSDACVNIRLHSSSGMSEHSEIESRYDQSGTLAGTWHQGARSGIFQRLQPVG